MRWLWLAISIVSFAVAFRTHSMGLAALCLLVGLGCVLMFVLALAASRIENSGRDASALLGPDEIRKMREAVERRKREGNDGGATASSATGGSTAGGRRPADRSDESVAMDSGGDGGGD